MRVDYRAEGLAHLTRVLAKELPQQAQATVVRTALRRASKPMERALRAGYQGQAAAAGSSGALATAVQTWSNNARRARRVKGVNVIASIAMGPRRSSKRALQQYYDFYGKTATTQNLKNGIRHGHLVEWGFQHESGKSVGGKGIMGRVADAHGPGTIARFRSEYGKAIDRKARALARLQKRSKK